MDALKFVRETNRMCKSFGDSCEGCSANDVSGCMVDQLYEEIVPIVEKWSSAHPSKTRQDVFLEQWSEVEIDEKGILLVCPKLISTDYREKYGSCTNRFCSDCRREFWMQEVE